MRWIRFCLLWLASAGLLGACGQESGDGAAGTDKNESPQSRPPLIVYASHNAAETAAVLDIYRAETGQPFQLLTDDMPEQETRLGNARLMPGADLFIGASLAELWAVAEADALRPNLSPALADKVAPAMRDSESRWFALSSRARVVAYNSDLVDEAAVADIQSYGALGDRQWQGRLCVSASGVPGNRALIAFLIRHHGARDAEIIVRKWRANLAMTVFINDGTLLNAIADGRCHLGLVDSNVLASFLDASPDTLVRAHWFAEPSNTLVDISGAGVTRHARDADAAAALLEWLVSPAANSRFARLRFETPVNPDASAGDTTAGWSVNTANPAALTDIGFLLEEADRLIERAGYP